MTVPANWKRREFEILQLLAQGLTNSEIGVRLHLTHETVRWYNKHIFEKLGVNNRLQAVARAVELGLLSDSVKAPAPKSAASPTQPPVQYTANGDVHIAYQVIGQGPVDLLFIHGFLSHLELAWENLEFTSFFEQLGRSVRVILFDKRGVGLSDRIQGAPTLENTIEDARCVLDAAGSKRVFVMGTSEGGAAAVLLASTYPERVLGLILYAATPKVVQTEDGPAWASRSDRFERMIEQMQKTWGGPWAVENFAPSRAHDEQFRAWWARILRAASSPSSVKAVLDLVREVDIRPLLPEIRIKTLVVHKTDDRMVSVEAGRYIATHMPNATWVELPGADHVYFIESAALLSVITQFCKEKTAHSGVDTWVAIILYARTNGLSVKELQTHINSYDPRHTTSTNRGIVAMFDSPTRAIQCAQRLRGGARPPISLHVGACHVVNGQPLESVLGIAERAAELAAPGEIVITRTLRDILAGSGAVFEERTEPPARNLPQNIPLYTLA
jgi:pimeloyl-ACP methyl ester carboxylesterase/DNA-binding CsgD family transcriptional regulator